MTLPPLDSEARKEARAKCEAQIVESLREFRAGIGSAEVLARDIIMLIEMAAGIAANEARGALPRPTDNVLSHAQDCPRVWPVTGICTCWPERDRRLATELARLSALPRSPLPTEPSERAIRAATEASGFVDEDSPPDAMLLRAVARMLRAAYAAERESGKDGT